MISVYAATIQKYYKQDPFSIKISTEINLIDYFAIKIRQVMKKHEIMKISYGLWFPDEPIAIG